MGIRHCREQGDKQGAQRDHPVGIAAAQLFLITQQTLSRIPEYLNTKFGPAGFKLS